MKNISKFISMSMVVAMTALLLSACGGSTTSAKASASDAALQESAKEAYMATMETGGKSDKVPDPNAPVLAVVAIYSTADDGSISKSMDGIDELDPQMLLDKLIEYKSVDETTQLKSFDADTQATETVEEVQGPGAKLSKSDSKSVNKYKGTDATINFSNLVDSSEKTITEIANTYIENFELSSITIQLDGKVIAEKQVFNKTYENIK